MTREKRRQHLLWIFSVYLKIPVKPAGTARHAALPGPQSSQGLKYRVHPTRAGFMEVKSRPRASSSTLSCQPGCALSTLVATCLLCLGKARLATLAGQVSAQFIQKTRVQAYTPQKAGRMPLTHVQSTLVCDQRGAGNAGLKGDLPGAASKWQHGGPRWIRSSGAQS